MATNYLCTKHSYYICFVYTELHKLPVTKDPVFVCLRLTNELKVASTYWTPNSKWIGAMEVHALRGTPLGNAVMFVEAHVNTIVVNLCV